MCPDPDLLKDIPLFKLLDEQERKELAAQLTLVRFAAGETIFFFGDPGDACYIIAEGEVEIYFKNDTGERIVLERARAGHVFGELSLVEGGSRNASAEAATDTATFRLSHVDLEKYLLRRPQAAMHLLAAMSHRLRSTAEQLRHTASRNVNVEVEDKRTTVQKVAESIAAFTGSIPFLIIHAVLFAIWLTVNSVKIPFIPQFDPFPFGFLTLSVSLEAIFLSCFVLLSQNLQSLKDRVRSDIEYEVNLKAELEVAHLHEKVDRLTSQVLHRLEKIQCDVDKP